jgi:hypothetical protein
MQVAAIPSVSKPRRSISDMGLFSLKRRVRTDHQLSISLDLGCCAVDDKSGDLAGSRLRPEDEDSIFMQLEGGLFGTAKLPTASSTSSLSEKISGGGGGSSVRYFPFQRGSQQVDQSTSNQTIDSDHFLWSGKNDKNAVATHDKTIPTK